MSENNNLNLNALRKSLTEGKESHKETRTEQIQRIRDRISELEGKQDAPSMGDLFSGLTSEEQEAEVQRLIAQGDRPPSYTVTDRANELKERDAQTPFGSIRLMRLDLLRQELLALESNNSDDGKEE